MKKLKIAERQLYQVLTKIIETRLPSAPQTSEFEAADASDNGLLWFAKSRTVTML